MSKAKYQRLWLWCVGCLLALATGYYLLFRWHEHSSASSPSGDLQATVFTHRVGVRGKVEVVVTLSYRQHHLTYVVYVASDWSDVRDESFRVSVTDSLVSVSDRYGVFNGYCEISVSPTGVEIRRDRNKTP